MLNTKPVPGKGLILAIHGNRIIMVYVCRIQCGCISWEIQYRKDEHETNCVHCVQMQARELTHILPCFPKFELNRSKSSLGVHEPTMSASSKTYTIADKMSLSYHIILVQRIHLESKIGLTLIIPTGFPSIKLTIGWLSK